MTVEQAERAAATLEDVFTSEGDAVVIDRIFEGSYSSDSGAIVSGQSYFEEWVPLRSLTAKEDLK